MICPFNRSPLFIYFLLRNCIIVNSPTQQWIGQTFWKRVNKKKDDNTIEPLLCIWLAYTVGISLDLVINMIKLHLGLCLCPNCVCTDNTGGGLLVFMSIRSLISAKQPLICASLYKSNLLKDSHFASFWYHSLLPNDIVFFCYEFS